MSLKSLHGNLRMSVIEPPLGPGVWLVWGVGEHDVAEEAKHDGHDGIDDEKPAGVPSLVVVQSLQEIILTANQGGHYVHQGCSGLQPGGLRTSYHRLLAQSGRNPFFLPVQWEYTTTLRVRSQFMLRINSDKGNSLSKVIMPGHALLSSRPRTKRSA